MEKLKGLVDLRTEQTGSLGCTLLLFVAWSETEAELK